MGSHPIPLVQAFDGGGGGADIQLLSHQAMGDAVEMVVHLDMVIDMDPGFAPMGKLVGGLGQRPHRRPVELFETTAATAGEFAEGTVIEQLQALPDGGVGLRQAEEGALTKPGQNETLGDQHAPFDLGLVLGTANAGGDNGGAVMVGEFGIAGIEVRLIAAGLGDSGAQVVRDHAMGNGAKITEGPDMGTDPVGQTLSPGRLGVGQVAVAHDPDEDLGFPDLPRRGVHDGQGHPAVVDEKLVAGAVLLAHGTIQLLAPLPIEFAELAVLVPGGFAFLVLLPEQHEGEVFVASQFIVQRLPVRLVQFAG